MIKAQSQFTEEELVQGLKLHYRRMITHRLLIWLMRIIGAFFVISSLITVAYFLMTEQGDEVYSIVPGFVMGIFFIFVSFITLWKTRRNLRKLPALNKQVNWTIDDTGFGGKSEGFDFSTSWPMIYSVTIEKEGLLVYPQKYVFHWLPASGFQSPEEYEAAKAIIKTHVKKVVEG